MKYYLDKIEQIKGETEGTYSEYGSRTKYATFQAARTEFYDVLKNVSNSAAHVYFDVKIVSSEGGIVKRDFIGKYVDTE